MIKSIKILNFQSHKDSSLDLAPGVNVIVGASDCGKTAIIRALRWLIWNRPNGDAFRSNWGGETRVDIEAENQHWFRSKGKQNHYHYNGRTLAAFGTDVPEEIQKSLNMDETNLQMQLDAPFLISSSPGEVSAYFNKVAHLDQIDSSLKAITKEITSINTEKKINEAKAEALQIDLSAFDYLEKFEIELEVLEEEQKQVNQKRAAAQNLKSVIKEIEEIDASLTKKQLIINFEEQVTAVLARMTAIDELKTSCSLLKTTLKELSDIENKLITLKDKVQLMPQVTELLLMWDKWQTLDNEIREFKKTGREIKNTKAAIEKTENEIEKLETKFHKHMPDRCPLCGSDLGAKMTKS